MENDESITELQVKAMKLETEISELERQLREQKYTIGEAKEKLERYERIIDHFLDA